MLDEFISNPDETSVLKYYIIYLLLILFHSYIKDPKNPEKLKTKIVARLLTNQGSSYSEVLKTFEILWNYFEKTSKETRVKDIEKLAEIIKNKSVPEKNIIKSLKGPIFNNQQHTGSLTFKPTYYIFPTHNTEHSIVYDPKQPHSIQPGFIHQHYYKQPRVSEKYHERQQNSRHGHSKKKL